MRPGQYLQVPEGVTATAVFSEPGRQYRYCLEWSSGPGATLTVIGFHPHTHEAKELHWDDRRPWQFAESWGMTRMIVVNCFSYRTESYLDLEKAKDPIGPKTDEAIFEACAQADLVIASWGYPLVDEHRARCASVAAMLEGAGIPLFAGRVGYAPDQKPGPGTNAPWRLSTAPMGSSPIPWRLEL
jgi:hypothetical protein